MVVIETHSNHPEIQLQQHYPDLQLCQISQDPPPHPPNTIQQPIQSTSQPHQLLHDRTRILTQSQTNSYTTLPNTCSKHYPQFPFQIVKPYLKQKSIWIWGILGSRVLRMELWKEINPSGALSLIVLSQFMEKSFCLFHCIVYRD